MSNKMSKHTPIPWRKDGTGILGNNRAMGIEAIVAIVGGVNCSWVNMEELRSEDHANAQRIVDCVNALEGFADPSAAADLLEAAKLAEKWIFENAPGEIEPEAYRALKQAITKAQGKEPNDPNIL